MIVGRITFGDVYIYTHIEGETFKDWYEAHIYGEDDMYVEELFSMVREHIRNN